MDFFNAVTTLVLVMDPLGNIPFIIKILQNVPPKRRWKIIMRELIIALIAMLLFFFLGKEFIQLLELENYSLQIGGGIILFLISLQMVLPGTSKDIVEKSSEEPFIVPIAIPLIAGPSVLTIIVLLSDYGTAFYFKSITAISIAWIITSFIILAAPFIEKILTRKGMSAVEKLMGLILLTLSIQILLNGFTDFYKSI